MSLSITHQAQALLFTGELSRETLGRFIPFTLLLGMSGKVSFDFSGLTNVDSAGLAWLLEQLAVARTRNLQIVFLHVPAQLLALAKVSAVTSLLPIIE